MPAQPTVEPTAEPSSRHHRSAPPRPFDATVLGEWTAGTATADLAVREFVGTVREASGFTISVLGAQRENGTTLRRVTIEPPDASGLLEAEAVRQLSAMLRDAADEIDRLR